MATNRYLQDQGFFVESDLINSITVESIQWGGINVQYIPRTFVDLDLMYGEDVLSQFDTVIPIEVYLENVSGWEGESQFISKFGLEVRDGASLVMSRTRFIESVVPFLPEDRKNKLRPLEGDLLYYPIARALFEIKFVEDEDPFYQTGQRFVWKLSVEKFRYNSEKFNTGDEFIDSKFGDLLNRDRINNTISLQTGFKLKLQNGGNLLRSFYDEDSVRNGLNDGNEILSYGDNAEIKKRFLDIAEFSEDNPFGDKF